MNVLSLFAEDSGISDIPMLLQTAELLVGLILPSDGSRSNEATSGASQEPAGLFGYVSGVLTGDTSMPRSSKYAVRQCEVLNRNSVGY